MQYLSAIVCLQHVVELDENDRTGHLLLSLWLCYMDEWELIGQQFRTQLTESASSQPIQPNQVYSLIMRVIAEAYTLNTGDDEVCFVLQFKKLHKYHKVCQIRFFTDFSDLMLEASYHEVVFWIIRLACY